MAYWLTQKCYNHYLKKSHTQTRIDGSKKFQMRSQTNKLSRIRSTLQCNQKFLDTLSKRLRSLEFIDDALHVRFVTGVAIQKSGPLIGRYSQTRFCGYLYDLGVMFSSQSLISPKFLFQLHQGRITLSFWNL